MSEADKPSEQEGTLTFWDHLDELRAVLIRILVITTIAALAAFCLKEELFAVVLAPRSSDFITYRMMGVEPFCINLMNTGLTEQFMIHLRTALYAGVLAALPYILYQLFRFVSPALYDHERRYATLLVGSGYMMFMMGTLLNYLLIFGEVPGNLPGEPRCGEHAYHSVVYRHIADDELCDGDRL